MKKIPHQVNEGAKARASAIETISPRNPCPHAPECRTRWTYLEGTETAACGHCYQTLTRADLARMIEGRA